MRSRHPDASLADLGGKHMRNPMLSEQPEGMGAQAPARRPVEAGRLEPPEGGVSL